MAGRGHDHITECWCCGRHRPHQARGLCERCYNRWQYHGFTGPGPGPEWVPQPERAQEYAQVISGLSARQAAAELGVSARTVVRWRRALAGAA